MATKRKLQVFVSSTYTDLRQERQAAVQAILNAGHIPAGMELFAAGDDDQMKVIKRWIDESDVFVLILGGRYGSIEPKSGKSYIHLEYEYAVKQKKPHFAVVIDKDHLDEKVRREGLDAAEQDHPDKLKEFKRTIGQKMVRFWKDDKDITIAIFESLSEFAQRDELTGWVRGDQAVDTKDMAEQLARLTRENSELQEQLKTASRDLIVSGMSFDELCEYLRAEPFLFGDLPANDIDAFNAAFNHFKEESPSAYHLMFWLRYQLRDDDDYLNRMRISKIKSLASFCRLLISLAVAEETHIPVGLLRDVPKLIQPSEAGLAVVNRMIYVGRSEKRSESGLHLPLNPKP